MSTDARRILAALAAAGDRGLTQGRFLRPDVVDGGRPIDQFDGRVQELRTLGFPVQERGQRRGYAVLVLDPASIARIPPSPCSTCEPEPTRSIAHVTHPAFCGGSVAGQIRHDGYRHRVGCPTYLAATKATA